MKGLLDGKTVLVTGGTGSFGRKFIELVLAEHSPDRLIVFSRDELKQHEMRASGLDRSDHPCLRYFIGDVRDLERLHRATQGVDVIVHAAAMKQVPACEYNPVEAIRTNVDGARNIATAALDNGVDRVIALSTDKAVNPTNLYGATKLCAEKLLIQSNVYVGSSETKFSCVRYGNVAGSRGSVIPLFLAQREHGRLTVTDPRMTRFWLTLEQGVRFVLTAIAEMRGGEVFVPKIPSTDIMALASAIASDADIDVVGIRAGEKLHEVLVSADEARHTLEREDMYVIRPEFALWGEERYEGEGTPVRPDFEYTSETNDRWLTPDELRDMVGLVESHA